MKILIDTNVILDIILDRKPFNRSASLLLQIANHQAIPLFITATTITDLYYIIRKEKGKKIAFTFLEDILKIVNVALVDEESVIKALYSDIPDFEDAIQVYSAKREFINIIVTRNKNDFKNSGLIIESPDSMLQLLQIKQ